MCATRPCYNAIAMTKQELITNLETARQRLEKAIEPLTPEQMMTERALGDWSVKDALAHLAVWTARCVTVVFSAEQGIKPREIDAMLDQYEALNAADYMTQKERPLELILADLRGAHKQLLRRLNAWDEADLFSTSYCPWLRGKSLADFLTGEVPGHDTDHAQQIEQWITAQ
jgi:hypothetical protein